MQHQVSDMSYSENALSPVLFLPHGGGPMPLFDPKGHEEMISFLTSIPSQLGSPSEILLISAHWEETMVSITGAEYPELNYDYYGFPKEMYDIDYPVKGSPTLAQRVHTLLEQSNIDSKIDSQRGFDHGMYVPLKIMYPKANIPCVQISLSKSLDPAQHIKIGQALRSLRQDNILIIGSGFSFHNLKVFMSKQVGEIDEQNEAFEQWLINTCSSADVSAEDREKQLIQWEKAPAARYCHPREEHLLPLHVCAGLAGTKAKLVFEGKILGKKASAFLW